MITHRIPLAAAPEAYETFRDKKDGRIKVVIKPDMAVERMRAELEEKDKYPEPILGEPGLAALAV